MELFSIEKLQATQAERLKNSRVKFEVEEWGMALLLKPLSVGDLTKIAKNQKKLDKEDQVLSALAIVCQSVDGMDFDKDADQLKKESIEVITRIMKKILEISNLKNMVSMGDGLASV